MRHPDGDVRGAPFDPDSKQTMEKSHGSGVATKSDSLKVVSLLVDGCGVHNVRMEINSTTDPNGLPNACQAPKMNAEIFWSAREASWNYLNSKHPSRVAVVLRTFELIDRCIAEYEAKASTDIFARICGITLLKGKNLAHGSLSLVLDALGQESGALLRPWIESIELLTYLRKFPEEAARAAENDLPSAGIRAMKIDGIFKGVREYLNDNASHSSYSSHSLSHLLTPDFKFRKLQEFVPQVLDENLANFAAQQQLLLQEGLLSLQPLALTTLPILELEAQHLRREMLLVFELGGV